jgi:hypothetical protein
LFGQGPRCFHVEATRPPGCSNEVECKSTALNHTRELSQTTGVNKRGRANLESGVAAAAPLCDPVIDPYQTQRVAKLFDERFKLTCYLY